MKCIKCGYEFDEGLFCPECGTKFDEQKAQKIEEEHERHLEAQRLEELKQREIERQKAELESRTFQGHVYETVEDMHKAKQVFEEVELAKSKVELERVAKERAEKEAELLKQQNEKMRLEQESAEKKAIAEKQRAEIGARTFRGRIYETAEEMRKAKESFERVELEKAAKERAEKEAELLKQQNEKMRLEQEAAEKRAIADKKRAEIAARTFNGQVYETIEEMRKAKVTAEEEKANKIKKIKRKAIWSLVLSIASYPLMATLILWIPAVVVSAMFAMDVIKSNVKGKRMAISSLIIDAVVTVIAVATITIALMPT